MRKNLFQVFIEEDIVGERSGNSDRKKSLGEVAREDLMM